MESVKASVTRYALLTRVVSVEEVKPITRGWKDADGNTQYEYGNLGWFVGFEGSWERLCFGHTKPSFAVGDLIKITFEKTPS